MTLFHTFLKGCIGLLALALFTWFVSQPGSAQDSVYRVQPGDVLRIEVLEDNTLNRSALVLPDGRITMPLAGSIQAGGRTVEQVRASIAAGLTSSFALAPSVFVSVERLSGGGNEPGSEQLTIYVIGEARNPGVLQVQPDSTVMQVFVRMGGFTNFAALKRIQLRRVDPLTGQEKLYGLNYRDIQRGESNAGLLKVQDGDVILVPQRRLFE